MATKKSPTRVVRKRTAVTAKVLDAFADAWNRHDVDELMRFMSEDCVFEASAGSARLRDTL